MPSAVASLYFSCEVMSTIPGSTLADSAFVFSGPDPLLVPPPLPAAAAGERAGAVAAERVLLAAAAAWAGVGRGLGGRRGCRVVQGDRGARADARGERGYGDVGEDAAEARVGRRRRRGTVAAPGAAGPAAPGAVAALRRLPVTRLPVPGLPVTRLLIAWLPVSLVAAVRSVPVRPVLGISGLGVSGLRRPRLPGCGVLRLPAEVVGAERDRVTGIGRAAGAGRAVTGSPGGAPGTGGGCPRADVLRWLPAALLLATAVVVSHLSRLHREQRTSCFRVGRGLGASRHLLVSVSNLDVS